MTDNNGFLDGYVLYLMARASDVMSSQFHTIIRENGLRVPQWRVLASLASHGPQSISQLSEKCLFDQPRLTKTVQKLESAGWVSRSRLPGDQRVVTVELTEKGADLVSGLIAKAKTHETGALSVLTEHQQAVLREALRILINRGADARRSPSDQIDG